MRIRTIKPEFWLNESLAQQSDFTRLLAIALLNWADDEGYFLANSVLIRGQLFPFDDDSTKVRRSIDELSNIGYIELGKDPEGRSVGRIVKFDKHQRIDRPKPSKIKGFYTVSEQSTNDRRRIDDTSLLEQGTGNREQGSNNNKNQRAREPFAESPSLEEAKRFAELHNIPEPFVEKWHATAELNEWNFMVNGKPWSNNLLAYWKAVPPADQRKWRDQPSTKSDKPKTWKEMNKEANYDQEF